MSIDIGIAAHKLRKKMSQRLRTNVGFLIHLSFLLSTSEHMSISINVQICISICISICIKGQGAGPGRHTSKLPCSIRMSDRRIEMELPTLQRRLQSPQPPEHPDPMIFHSQVLRVGSARIFPCGDVPLVLTPAGRMVSFERDWFFISRTLAAHSHMFHRIICRKPMCFSMYRSMFRPIELRACLPICLRAYQSVHLAIHLFVYLSVYLPICLSAKNI